MTTWLCIFHLDVKGRVYASHAIVCSHHCCHHLFLFKPVQVHSVSFFLFLLTIMLNHLKLP